MAEAFSHNLYIQREAMSKLELQAMTSRESPHTHLQGIIDLIFDQLNQETCYTCMTGSTPQQSPT